MVVKMVDSVSIDSDDARILRALQIAPRAPFAVVGSTLGLSEVTVARRWRRMVDGGVARVAGALDTAALGRSQWLVQMECGPGAAPDMAAALVRRADVPFVATTGNDHLTFIVTARTHEQRQELLTVRIPSTRAAVRQESVMVLHRFDLDRGAAWTALGGVLDDSEEQALGAHATMPRSTTRGLPALEPNDHRLLATLAEDGRASLVELAASVGSTSGQVARRLDRLTASGAVRVRTSITEAAIGGYIAAILRLRVRPSAVRAIGTALVTSPSVSGVLATTGPTQLTACTRSDDLESLFAFATDTVGAHAGVEGVEVTPVLEYHKIDGHRVRDGLFR